MKNLVRLTFTLLLFAFIWSCKTQKPASSGTTRPFSDAINSNGFRKPMKDKVFYNETSETIPLDTVFVSKDSLNIVTRKIQGCDVESFKLVWNGAMAKSLPPQTNLKLFKAAETDCKEKHRFHLIFNITPLHFKQDSTAKGTTIIHMSGWKEPIKYEFDSIPHRQRNKN